MFCCPVCCLSVIAMQGAETCQQQQQQLVLAYAGVGVVQGSEVDNEWQELCLKVMKERDSPGLGEILIPY